MLCPHCGHEYADTEKYCPVCGKDNIVPDPVDHTEIHFGHWDPSTHMQESQRRKIATAKKSTTSPSAIDEENKIGIFAGSGKKDYTTSLESCSCGSFISDHLPCKHMYRLAMELHLMDADLDYGINRNVFLKEVPALSLTWDTAICINDHLRGIRNGSDEVFSLNRTEHASVISEAIQTGLCRDVSYDANSEECDLVVSDTFKPYIVAISRKVSSLELENTVLTGNMEYIVDPNHPETIEFKFKQK